MYMCNIFENNDYSLHWQCSICTDVIVVGHITKDIVMCLDMPYHYDIITHTTLPQLEIIIVFKLLGQTGIVISTFVIKGENCIFSNF